MLTVITNKMLQYYKEMSFEKWINFCNANKNTKQLGELTMTLTDYSSIEDEIKDAPEMEILPAKSEVKVRIVKVDSGVIDDESKKSFGAEWHSITFDVPEEANAPMFNHFMWDLTSRDKLDEKQYNAALRNFRDFAECFNIDYSRPFDWETDLIGKEGWVVLKIVKDKTGEYPDKNGVAKFIVPK